MPNECLTCEHPQREAIDALLVAGRSQRGTAGQFGLGRDSVRRHAENHVAGMPRQGGGAAPTPDPDASAVEVLREALDALRAMDPTRLSASAQVARIDSIRRAAESIGKMDPPAPAGVGVRDVRGMDQFIAILFEELEAYPDVRERLHARMTAEGVFAP